MMVKTTIIAVTRMESTKIRQIGESDGKIGYSWKYVIRNTVTKRV